VRRGHREHVRLPPAAQGAHRPRSAAVGHHGSAHRCLQPPHLSRAKRAGQPLSIIIVDIDHFKPINEKYGNRIGDQVLQRIATLVYGALRKEDMLVRYGGEEFLVMLPDVPGPGAVVVAGRIRKSVEAEPLKVGDYELAVTVSIGVSARLDEGPESVENLLGRADEALALAKQRGRNRVVALSLGRSIAA
jgi:diguanylate cyclase (GGDEF)-like protein